MIIDAHVHVFPPEIIANRAAHAPGEEAYRLIYTDPRARMMDADSLAEALTEQGVDKAVVCGFPWRDSGRAAMHNDYILDAAARYPDVFIPLACFDALAPLAKMEAERCLYSGFAGLGELAVYGADIGEPGILTEMVRLGGMCAEARKPMLLHTNEPVGHNYPGKSPMTLAGLYQLLKDCPTTHFQLAHLGGGLFLYELLKKEVSDVLANCVFDTAAAPFLYRPEMYNVFIQLAGPDRLLYGSDFPLLSLPRYINDMKTAGIEDDLKTAILGANAARFWGVG